MRILHSQTTHRLLFVLAFLSLVAVGNSAVVAQRNVRETCKQTQASFIQSVTAPLSTSLTGNAAFVYNFSKDRVIYEKNADEPLPLASLTKLMTIRVALKQAKNPDSTYMLTGADLASEGSIGFIEGQTYSLRSLASAALIASSNDAATALMHSTKLSDQLFFQAMNQEARNLDLNTLQFQTSTGLDAEGLTPQAVGSARDVVRLLHKDSADFPDLFAQSNTQKLSIISTDGAQVALNTTNEALEKLPLLAAGKTGYTLSAGGNLAILWNASTPSHDVIGAVVLGSTHEGRFADMVALYDTTNTILKASNALPQACRKYVI